MKTQIYIFFLLVMACTSPQNDNSDDDTKDNRAKANAQADKSFAEEDSLGALAHEDERREETNVDRKNQLPSDSSLFFLAHNILLLVQEKNDVQLSKYFHPVKGVRFSPYSYADTIRHQKFLAHEFLKAGSKKFTWGNDAGSGDPIVLTKAKYFAEFVYDVDFINLSTPSLNRFVGFGNTINNVEEVYKGCPYVEYYFPGEKDNESFTWKSLTFVFEKYEGKYFLIAITHGQWTI